MKNTKKPFFTIIVATFNAESTLQFCLDSFNSQDFQDKELIIIDGGSSDATVDILKANDQIISYWISEPDSGIYSAWNKGLPHAKGDWIYFLGADDFFWDKDVLEKVSIELNSISEEIKVVYGEVNYVSSKGTFLYKQGLPWPLVRKRFRQLMTIPHQGVMHRNSLFIKHGEFDESFKIAGDYEFLLRELKESEAVFIPVIVAAMSQGGVSNDNTNSLRVIREVRRAQVKNGIRWPGFFWMLALIRVYLRILLWFTLGEQKARKVLDYGRSIMGKPAHWTKNL